jgi:hypothetical protein
MPQIPSATNAALEASQIPMMLAAGPETEPPGGALGRITPRGIMGAAGERFQQLESAIGKNPIDVTEPGQLALKLEKLKEAGTSVPGVVGKFIDRVKASHKRPLTYSEARQFYKNMGDLSAAEKSSLNKQMRYFINDYGCLLGTPSKTPRRRPGNWSTTRRP